MMFFFFNLSARPSCVAPSGAPTTQQQQTAKNRVGKTVSF
jgi:hypothetical protein